MTIWQELRNYISARLAVRDAISLPMDGRSSRDEKLDSIISRFAGANQEIAPGINFETLRCLKTLWITHPTLSQAVGNLQALANTGHKITLETKNVEAILKRLDETAARIYPNSYGVDGFVNDAIAQIMWSGALSREDVVDLAAKQVRKIVLVPPEQVRFVAKDHEWEAHQFVSGLFGNAAQGIQGIPLHPTTYRYYALTHVDNSPYAKPPFTAALERILKTETNMRANIDSIIEKLGIFGIFSVEVVQPPKKTGGGETEEEYQSRAQKYLSKVREVFEKNPFKNLMVTFKDQKVSHTSTTGDARGASELYGMNRLEVVQGIQSMPAFHGMTDSVTETFADVVWKILQAQGENCQNLVTRSLQRTYTLDLLLSGLDATGLSVAFNPILSRNILQEAQARQVQQAITIADEQAGYIDIDEAAQQRGYKKAANPKRKDGAGLVSLSWNGQQNRYEFERESISVSSLIVKKKQVN